MPLLKVTVMVMGEREGAVGVPERRPVVGLRESHAGRPVAVTLEMVVPGQGATTWWETGVLTSPEMYAALEIRGGAVTVTMLENEEPEAL